MNTRAHLQAIFTCILFAQQSQGAESRHTMPVDLKTRVVVNETAYIPSQCYTKTKATGRQKQDYNPCYVCHTRSPEPNYINDQDLQLAYSFPEPALVNPWSNLFEDRTERIQLIADQEIEHYIRQSNYLDSDGNIILNRRLRNLPPAWDYNNNGRWDGYTPDCWFQFDDLGFDRTPEGGYSGWRAFAYYPFPGTFWPTNGSTDDVLIRLPESFRNNEQGIFDLTVYRINLAIVEALITKRDVATLPVDEHQFGVDLDKDGRLGMAERIVFDWEPRENRTMSYVGQAKIDQEQGRVHLAAGLFPEGTEFLHSVRYIDSTPEGAIVLAARMKELRYMKKRTWKTYAALEESAINEIKEKDDFPDRTRQFIGNPEQGINNDDGWLLQGFIEDDSGNLRPQSFEETAYCIGCHGGTGATTDSVYGFPRKLDSSQYQEGWYHWSRKGLAGLNEPKVELRGAGVYYEYSYYLMYNRSGSEFRENPELEKKFFTPNSTVRPDMLNRLHDDISILLNPSKERALLLNKAYRTIVADQDFIYGREPNVAPVANVHREVEQDQPTGVKQPTSMNRFGGRFGEHGPGPVQTPLSVMEKKRGKEQKIFGKGMNGPNGRKYEVDWQGIIHKSRYSLDIPGVHFTFPPRITLPTRFIVPLGKNRVCYTCHRLEYPSIPEAALLVEAFKPAAGKGKMPPEMTRLTKDPGQDLHGKWSPDNSRIVFVSNRSGSDQLWLMDADGKNQRQLTSGPTMAAWPEWSPDGSRLVFWSYNPAAKIYGIEMVSAEGREENRNRKILVQSHSMLDRPTFHPDGEYIAYGAVTEGNWDIWLINPDTGKKWRLTSDPQMETNPLWRPDGKALAFKVAPGGEYSLTEEYFMTFEKGYQNPTIYRWKGPESLQMSGWSPDGRKITYTAEIISDSSGEDRVTYAAMVSDICLKDGQAIAQNSKILSKNKTLGDRGPVFSPDGEKIAFWSWDTSGNGTLWLHDLKTSGLTRLTNGGADMYPQWSMDGKKLLFTSTRSGNQDLVLLSLQKTLRQQLRSTNP
ncbi:hypothetical protein GF1_27470 [Desulfolithobacter dissulfuricans]|uniref:Uncharacterized protein n=1 Tax=Desulfolithobacter dissulfuricans TaxID=2795293 RepID=A0A915UAW4_9BACT|nr:hypothetical protein [Desulfolithobacter dissulfuricans]BCO10371.1 hypothetical protein GF1_27470 [Desulfolithobacter dissulfuricans]